MVFVVVLMSKDLSGSTSVGFRFIFVGQVCWNCPFLLLEFAVFNVT